MKNTNFFLKTKYVGYKSETDLKKIIIIIIVIYHQMDSLHTYGQQEKVKKFQLSLKIILTSYIIDYRPTPVKQKADTARGQHSLLHRKSLLVASSGNFKNIAFKFLLTPTILMVTVINIFCKSLQKTFEVQVNEHTSPSASPLTSCEILLSQKARLQFKVMNVKIERPHP
jgi:hypothetical protein